MNDDLIQKTTDYVRSTLSGDASGHDWWHIYRVHKLAKYLAQKEQANTLIVELAALLHDISDWKFNGGDEYKGGAVAYTFLCQIGADIKLAQQVSDIIQAVSFKGAHVADNMATLEGKIVQDADRLDAIGAIGIARAFAYGGAKGRPMYEPSISPLLHTSFEEYKKSASHTLNHFYEKLLLLKDRMNTSTAKTIAAQRHEFLEQYLAEFLKEWDLQFQ